MEAFYILLAIFAFCGFAKWFLMRPVDSSPVRTDLMTATRSKPLATDAKVSQVKSGGASAEIFEGKIISEFPEIDYSELDEPTYIRRNICVYTLEDAALWFSSKIISFFEVIDYSEYESPTYKRRKVAAALLRRERAKAAKLRKLENGTADNVVTKQQTKRRIAQEFLDFQPAIIA